LRPASPRLVSLLCAAGLGVALSAPACAQSESPTAIHELPQRGGPIDDQGPPRDHGGGRRRPVQLFFSPSGEPFLAKGDAPYPAAVWFARANTSHDGQLTRAQFMADAEAFFDKLDTNHDGVIDGFENQDYEQKVAPEILPRVGRLNAEDAGYGRDAPGVGRQAGTPRRGGGGGGPGGGGKRQVSFEGAAPYSLLNEPQAILGADFAFDQHITREEWRRATNERFDLLDTKHLGYLTLATLPKTPMQQLAEQAEARRPKADRKPAAPPAGD
jgi:hypothetical protein